jgi:hypothetical protein
MIERINILILHKSIPFIISNVYAESFRTRGFDELFNVYVFQKTIKKNPAVFRRQSPAMKTIKWFANQCKYKSLILKFLY